MKYRLEYSKGARDDLKRLDFSTAGRITGKIYFWSQQTNPFLFAKPLKGVFGKVYRFRVGDYRVLFELHPNNVISVLFILRVKHRREIYRV